MLSTSASFTNRTRKGMKKMVMKQENSVELYQQDRHIFSCKRDGRRGGEGEKERLSKIATVITVPGLVHSLCAAKKWLSDSCQKTGGGGGYG